MWFSTCQHKIKIMITKVIILFNLGRGGLPLISFMLEKFRLLCYAQAGSIFSLPGLTPFGRVVRTEIRSNHYKASLCVVLDIPYLNNKKKRLKTSFLLVWAGVDSNHRRLAPTDLQSVPFSHSGTYPYSFFKICL